MKPYAQAVEDLDTILQAEGLYRLRSRLARIDAEVGKLLRASAKIANDQCVEIERLTADLKFVNSALPREFISDGMGGVRKWRESWEAWVTDYARGRKLETEVRAALGIEREAITPADAATRLRGQVTELAAHLRNAIGIIDNCDESYQWRDDALKLLGEVPA